MREYLIRVMGASLLSSLVSGLLPDGAESKWIRFAAGLAVAATVLSPIGNRVRWSLPAIQSTEGMMEQNPYLMDAFEKNLAEKTEQLLLEQTGESVHVTVYGKTDGEGTICGVAQVTIVPYTETTARKTAEILGISKQEVVAE